MCAACCLAAAASAGEGLPLYEPRIIMLENDQAAAALESRGVVIWRRRADMALVLMPLSGADRAKGTPAAVYDRSRRAVPTLDKAKTYFGASRIHSGEGLPRPYSGAGVIVGFNDGGFDPHHINFLDADGKSRVRRLSHYDARHGGRSLLVSPDEIDGWITDNKDESHATHVAGILTGSYSGNGLSGMAPGADIVATTSAFTDVDILMGCEDIVDYARQTGKPAVINLSLGSYNGPHDGSSLFCRYLDLIGQEAIVCLSSGNEASATNSLRHTFSEAEPSVRVRVQSTDWTQFRMYGMTDAWSADSRPVDVRFMVRDGATKDVVYESPLYGGGGDFDVTLSSESDSDLARFFKGALRFRGHVDQLNGRWVTEVEYNAATDEPSPESSGAWARYTMALEFSAAPGVHADVTCDAEYSRLTAWPGYKAPDASLSVSDIATGRNVLCVGMYTNRISVPSLAGPDRTFGGDETGTVNRRSSYGTLIDGRVLPHVVAPGAWLISSTNSAFAAAHPDAVPDFCESRVIDGNTYYWDVNCGTSMSCPYVAGSIATWLEAVPSLTIDDVKEAIAATNERDLPDASNPRHGQGWFRPYEGLRYILENADISPGIGESGKPTAVIRGDIAEILNPGGMRLTVEIISTDGVPALPRRSVDGAVSEIDISELGRGVYVLRLSDGSHIPQSMKFVK